jgi:hypothetical protein
MTLKTHFFWRGYVKECCCSVRGNRLSFLGRTGKPPPCGKERVQELDTQVCDVVFILVGSCGQHKYIISNNIIKRLYINSSYTSKLVNSLKDSGLITSYPLPCPRGFTTTLPMSGIWPKPSPFGKL